MHWISVKDSLPEKGEDVLWALKENFDGCGIAQAHWNSWTQNKDKNLVATWGDGYMADITVDDCTHWAYLPEPPKE